MLLPCLALLFQLMMVDGSDDGIHLCHLLCVLTLQEDTFLLPQSEKVCQRYH
jgi:hypothetical protein